VPPSFVPPPDEDEWLAVGDEELPVAAVHDWCVVPRAGAVVLFSGTVRDHAADDAGIVRSGVQHLTYEAYDAQVVPSFRAIVDELRVRWPDTARVALLHRVGRLGLGESSVVAAVSAPHRAEAFEAAHFAIDALKAGAPIWKREQWQDETGTVTSAWGTGAHDIVPPSSVRSS
jgi:molybdopterin synthase catalytic subunit